MKLRSSIWLIALLFLIFGNSCKKWKNNREPLTSEDHTLAEASFNDILRHLMIAASPLGELLTDSCFSFTTSGSTFPKTITVDFGNKGCTGLFEFDTYGKISITLSDSLNHENAVMTGTPDNLHIRGYKIEGAFTLTNTGLNSSGNSVYQLKVSDGIISAEQQETGEDFTITWECDYLYELIEKNNAVILTDDLYQISGTASGVNEEDRSYTAEIIEPLKKYVDCRWPGSGKTKISPADLDERDLNYGECALSNCCDYEAMEEVKWADKTVRMR